MSETHHAQFFIYGSSSEGFVHHQKIAEFITNSEKGSVQATAYRLPSGYPVLIAGGHERVEGTLVTLEGPASFFALLDEFYGWNASDPEKSLFLKSLTTVETSSGQQEAQIYFLNPKKLPKDAEVIPDGAWKQDVSERPPLPDYLTTPQADYIRKLGASTGRQIVPIKLDLYRELMKLDLIVDKGRRLALTKLGKEVYRYLS